MYFFLVLVEEITSRTSCCSFLVGLRWSMRKAFLLSRELLIQETHHQIHFNASAVRVHNGKENRGLGELRNNSLIRLKK